MSSSMLSRVPEQHTGSDVSALPRIAFLVNGEPESAMGERARAFATHLAADFVFEIVYREGGRVTSTLSTLRQLSRFRPDLCYVLDMSLAGVSAAGAYHHATRTPFVVDTGDAIVPLGRALGRRGLSMWATEALEKYALQQACCVVVRGSYHQELLEERGIRTAFIPDGVDVDQFAAPLNPPKGPDEPLVIGLIGSPIWVAARQTCYGWELVELIRLLKDRLPRPVRGVLIGDGTGVPILKQRCRDYGILEQVDFPGRVHYAELPERLRTMDICLSTQTNDIIGQVRTTGKLPLYLAAGRFVLASRVGEAARILLPEMLVDFVGETDPGYPAKLAERIVNVLALRSDFAYHLECIALARTHFSYDLLADRLRNVLRSNMESNALGPSTRNIFLAPGSDRSICKPR